MTHDAERPGGPTTDGEAWRAAYRSRLPAGGDACPSEEELASLLVDELAPERRRELADHLIACARCGPAYRTLVELDRAAGRRADASPAGAARRRFAGWAAAAVLVVGVGLGVLLVGRGDESGWRGPRVAPDAVEPANGARLAAPPSRLAWSAGDPGVSYRVTLYDAEAVPIWESAPLAAPELALPSAARSRLAAGGTFYWRVRIQGDLGSRAGPLHRFEVAR